jgi:hypothetical protein
VLGHIFEQSVSDIETMRAEAQGQPPPKTAKERFGVTFTESRPSFAAFDSRTAADPGLPGSARSSGCGVA